MSDRQNEMAQALAEKSWIEDRLNEVRVRNEQGIPISIGDIETLLMMALDQGRALQIGVPIIEDIDRHQTGNRPGRPSKGAKVTFSVRIRQSVADQFRRFIGPGQILCEAVERALIEKMVREGKK